MKSPLFEIEDLHVEIEGKSVLKGISLEIQPGEVHAIMGRNGSGKTTLAYTLMGHPKYHVTGGDIRLDGESLLGLEPDIRAKKRLFLAFQHPVGIPGVTVANFLRSSIRSVRGSELPAREVRKMIKTEAAAVGIPDSFLTRSLDDGFSGGEKKRLETLQLRLLEPRLAVLDETDSGLDIDALRVVSERIESIRDPSRGILMITHYQRMLDHVRPDAVHVLLDGKIVKSGDFSLAKRLESQGYDWLVEGQNGG